MSKKKNLSDEDYLNMPTAASAHETTGLMPSLPQSHEEYEALQQLAGMGVPKDHKKKHE